jgi:hypothetical protein
VGNNPITPFAINSIAIAARINPIILVKTFIPVWLIYFDMYGTDLNAKNKMIVVHTTTSPTKK